MHILWFLLFHLMNLMGEKYVCVVVALGCVGWCLLYVVVC